jgi:hypothetical protein
MLCNWDRPCEQDALLQNDENAEKVNRFHDHMHEIVVDLDLLPDK